MNIRRPKTSFIFCLAGILISLLSTSWAEAARVDKVRGKKVLISLEGDAISAGQIFYTLGSDGKKKGILKILKVKDGKAIAVMGRGVAQTGMKLEKRSASSKTAAGRSTPSQAPGNARAYWGGMLGMGKQNMDVDLESGGNVALKGNGFNAKALFDYWMLDRVWFRGLAGLEQLSVNSSDTICGTDTPPDDKCKVDITYLTFDFWGRYLFAADRFRPWAGAGIDLLFPMSKETTAVEDSSITNTTVLAVGGGFDWFINPTMYIPVQIEYGLFPSSKDVSADYIAVRLGLAFPW